MFYDCVVCLGDPCNEVHGMLLVIAAKKQRVVYIFVCIYICVFVTLNRQCARIAIRGCILC